jgi:hypothetical protein
MVSRMSSTLGVRSVVASAFCILDRYTSERFGRLRSTRGEGASGISPGTAWGSTINWEDPFVNRGMGKILETSGKDLHSPSVIRYDILSIWAWIEQWTVQMRLLILRHPFRWLWLGWGFGWGSGSMIIVMRERGGPRCARNQSDT